MLHGNITHMALCTAFIALVSLGLAVGSAMAESGSIERLIQDATSASGAKRLQAVEALGNSGDLRALQPLLGLLHDANPSIREHALKALRALTQSLRHIYAHLAQWIDSLLLRLDVYITPEPPIERTQYPRAI